MWERAGDRTLQKYFDPEVMAVSVVSFSFSMVAQPSTGVSWVLAFLTTSRLSPQPLACLHWLVEPSWPELNSSALYSLQTPTRWYGHASTTTSDIWDRDVPLPLSLEWPVWSSSSGNNCHPVQRSLSSGASVYESIMGSFFISSHFISQFPLITATRMCHLLPVHYPEWHFARVNRSKHNTIVSH